MSNPFVMAYHRAAQDAGFVSDADFMNAWKTNPDKWSSIFTLRMNAINSLSI